MTSMILLFRPGTVRDCHPLAGAAAHYTRACGEVLRWALMLRSSGMTARR